MTTERLLRTASLALAAALLASPAIAQSQYAVSDTQLQTNITTALHNDIKLNNHLITVSAAQGVVTLAGSVPTEDARTEAEQVAAGVSGVKSIQDNIEVAGAGAPAPQAGAAPTPAGANEAPPPPDEPEANPAQAGSMPPPPPADPAQSQPSGQATNQAYTPYPNGSAQTPTAQSGGYGPAPERPGYRAPYNQSSNQSYPAQPDYGPRGNAHVPYGNPALAVSPQQQNASGPVNIPPGTLLDVRTTEPLSTENLRGGEYFQVTAANDIYSSGVLAIPRGAVLTGQVVESKNAGALGGAPKLDLKLTSLQLGATTYPVASDVWSSQGPSKSGYTATNTVGGAAVGALIGAIAGGGVGAGVGAIAGGATGAVVSGATHGPRLNLPPEALLQFHLASPIAVQPVTYDEAQRIIASAPQQPVLRARPAYIAAPYPYVVRPYPYPYARPYPYGYWRY